jgi:hypothetical protein
MKNRRIEPQEAVAYFGVGLWDEDRMVEWMLDRSGIEEKHAREVVQALASERTRRDG